MSDIDPQQFGRFIEKVERLEGSVEALTKSIEALNGKLNQHKGAWWMLTRFGSGGVLLIMAAGWVWDHIPHK